MSQAGLVNVIDTNPEIPITFEADSGSATALVNVIRFLGDAAQGVISSASSNTVTYTVADATTSSKGVSEFNPLDFSVTGGIVSILGSASTVSLITDISGPVSPDGTGQINVTGSTNIFSNGSVANTLRLNLQGTNNALFVGRGANAASANLAVGSNGQVLIAATSADPAFATLTSSDSSITFTAGANTLSLQVAGGTTVGKTITGNNLVALSPSSGNWNIYGASTAAGTSPVATSGSGSTLTVNVQKAQAIAATDATKVGLCNFDNTDFSVDANGFVTLSASGAGQTITGDSGGALSPSGGNWNVVGLSGSKTSGSGSTLTIKSPPYSDIGATGAAVKNTGEFITATCTRTFPASATLENGDLFEYATVGSAIVTLQCVGSQRIRIGDQNSSVAGSVFNFVNGDSISLRFRASDQVFYATSVVGTWQLI